MPRRFIYKVMIMIFKGVAVHATINKLSLIKQSKNVGRTTLHPKANSSANLCLPI